MIADVFTVIWKERKGMFRHRGSRSRAVLTLLVPVAVFAVYMPWQGGPEDWLTGPFSIVASILIPILMVLLTIPESFAGERERHTLETLLASRLSDRAILFGKMAVSVALGWGMALLTLLIGFIVVNATHWSGQLLFYTPPIAVANLVLSLVFAILAAGAGVIISLRAATVREAQQTLMAIVMFPLLLLGVAGTFLVTAGLEWVERILETMRAMDSWLLLLIVAVVLIAICLILIRLAMARFQRARLLAK